MMSTYFVIVVAVVCLLLRKARYAALACGCACLAVIVYIVQPSRGPEVRILNYGDYIPTQLLDEFTAETGVAVRYDVMPDAEGSMIEFELLMKCAPQDIVLLSLYPQAQRLAALGLLATVPQPIKIPYAMDRETISLSAEGVFWVPAMVRLAALGLLVVLSEKCAGIAYAVSKQIGFGGDEVFCVPYVLGTLSVACNKERVEAVLGCVPDNPLDLIFDAQVVKRLVDAGLHLSIVDSGLEVCASVGLYLESKWGRAPTLEEQQAHVQQLRKYYHRISLLLYTQDIQTGYADVVFGWSTFLQMAAKKNPAFVVIEPKEALAWVDVLVVPRCAPNYENACKFLEFISRPRNIQIISEAYYATPCFTPHMHHRAVSRRDHYHIQRWWQCVKSGRYTC